MKALIRALLSAIIAIPLSVVAFIIVAGYLILREPDGNPFIGGADDADSD